MIFTSLKEFAVIKRWGVGVLTNGRWTRMTWIFPSSTITTSARDSTSVSTHTVGIPTSGSPRPIIPTQPRTFLTILIHSIRTEYWHSRRYRRSVGRIWWGREFLITIPTIVEHYMSWCITIGATDLFQLWGWWLRTQGIYDRIPFASRTRHPMSPSEFTCLSLDPTTSGTISRSGQHWWPWKSAASCLTRMSLLEPQALLPEQRPLDCKVLLAMKLTQWLHKDIRLLPQWQGFLARLPEG